MEFKKLLKNELLLKNIEEIGYVEATEIQENVIPKVKSGKDIIGLAQTGTGKTAAFALPLLENLLEHVADKQTKILILTPTRELAIQIRDNIMEFRRGTDFKCSVILGGINQHSQKAVIKRGMEIIVATPGRLKDLLNNRKIRLDTVKTVVLDEADTMLDMGFIHDITDIIKRCPKNRQTLLFSATMPDSVKKLAASIMTNPLHVKVNSIIPKEQMKQVVYYVSKEKKKALLLDLISTKEKPSTIIFARTKIMVDELEELFNEYKIKVSVLHGDKKQSNRVKAIKDFKEGKVRFLIATDVAARGIDVNDLGLVINFDVPDKKELYIHRIGRTARAGKTGTAITLCSNSEKKDLEKIERTIGLTLPSVDHKYKAKAYKKKEFVKEISKPKKKKNIRKTTVSKGPSKKYSSSKVTTKKKKRR